MILIPVSHIKRDSQGGVGSNAGSEELGEKKKKRRKKKRKKRKKNKKRRRKKNKQQW